MDEAFLPFNRLLENMCDLQSGIYDEENGIHSYISRLEIDTPVELDVFTDENGKINVGIVPPLYWVQTSIEPVYHSLRFSVEKLER